MPAPIYSQDDYTAALQALLPRGRAWPRDPGAVQTQVSKGLAASLARVNQDANDLLVDAFPATAVQLLPEWEATLGLSGTGTTAQRQAAVVAALTATGGQSKAYFTALAASLGFAITITEYRPHRVSDYVSRPIAGAGTIFSWLVTTRATGNHAALEAAFRQYAPAHTVVGFNYV